MKQYWQQLVFKIDAMSGRERIMVLAMVAVVLMALLNAVLLEPLFAKKKLLAQRVMQDQGQIATIRAEIQQKMQLHAFDPDVANRARLQQVKQQSAQMQASLRDMQKGLVSPEKMPALLEDILKRNGQLRLVALKTLPATSLNEPLQTESKMPAEAGGAVASAAQENAKGTAALGGVYKHGVEIVVQGSYLDLMKYMADLEALPWQLFWGKVNLNVETYPNNTLTLTLFTLSLDKKWLAI